MFEKIKAKIEAEAKEKTQELLAFLAHELKQLTASIEKAIVTGLDRAEDLDDELVKDIEELHAKADALEAKIRAKIAADQGQTAAVADAELPEGTKVEGVTESGEVVPDPTATTASDTEASKS